MALVTYLYNILTLVYPCDRVMVKKDVGMEVWWCIQWHPPCWCPFSWFKPSLHPPSFWRNDFSTCSTYFLAGAQQLLHACWGEDLMCSIVHIVAYIILYYSTEGKWSAHAYIIVQDCMLCTMREGTVVAMRNNQQSCVCRIIKLLVMGDLETNGWWTLRYMTCGVVQDDRGTNKPALTETKKYYEESLGGVPGGEECLQLREGERREWP